MSFVVRIIPLLKPIKYKAGEYLWEEGDHSSSSNKNLIKVIFLVKGNVNFFIENTIELDSDKQALSMIYLKLGQSKKKKTKKTKKLL